MDKFIISVNFVLQHEGGYVNDPKDPGGETNMGISKRAYPLEDIKNMTTSRAMVLYRQDYWTPIKGDDKPFGLACAMLDTSVNMGVHAALTLSPDTDPNLYLQARLVHYLDIIAKRPELVKYKSGWFNRVNDLKKYISIHQGDFQ